MQLREVIERIRFNTSTVNDLSGKSVQPLFTNKNLLLQLKFALDKYSFVTKAIEAIYSFPLDENVKYVNEPPNILRSEAYRLFLVYVQGRIYLLKMPDLNLVNTYFPYEITSIPRFVIPWEKLIYFYPSPSVQYQTTNLTAYINSTDTTIPVEAAGNFILKNGRLTIGDEKIVYQYSDATNFYGCTRGIEDTTPTSHNIGDEVKENNCVIFYYKKHWEPIIQDDNYVDPIYANREMEVCDEHIEIITDYVSYKLLSKVDPERAKYYKVNFDEWLNQAKYYIQKSRSKITRGNEIHNPFLWETDNYLGYNL